ncbi:unnamed protein product [Linum tenue]|uniref:Uncharacterized protein n=1 Tax=Linum tenue TaxID=586396 RepID=A0AAV0H1B7_9ROSI|nr:unnamed protein product [Linum tenue]
MTTAARPTWAPAKGGNEQGGTRIFGASQKYSSRDLAAHTNLKPRREGQDTQGELQKRDLRAELEQRERKHFSSKDRSYSDDRDRRRGSQLLLEGLKRDAEDRIVPRSQDADDSDGEANNSDKRLFLRCTYLLLIHLIHLFFLCFVVYCLFTKFIRNLLCYNKGLLSTVMIVTMMMTKVIPKL